MSATPRALRRDSSELLQDAVHQNRTLSVDGLLERGFTYAFKHLVYPQIWEDPVIDMEALQIDGSSRMITIASGGCNVFSYLTASPEHITAVDLNSAHIALNKLKLAAIQNLPDHDHFYRMFANAQDVSNKRTYQQYLANALDPATKAYWESKDWRRRPTIERFQRNFYRYGLLGKFISLAHGLGKMYGVNPRNLMEAKTKEEQIEIYDREFAPIFEKRFVRFLLDRKWSLYGLGIPPAQYEKLAGDKQMSEVVNARLRKLACDFPIAENYFAAQAFQRSYEDRPGASVPPYLEKRNFAALKANADRVEILHQSFTAHLQKQPSQSMDRYILLDAQDWMDDNELNELWSEITRTARPGARVLFRTADEPSLLPGRVIDETLDQWTYQEEQSLDFTQRDRSAIYGGVHLYTLNAKN